MTVIGCVFQVTVRLLHILIRQDDQWLSEQSDLVAALTRVWCSGRYDEGRRGIGLSIALRKEQRQMAKILLHYFQKRTHQVELLFHLLRALCDRTIPDFYFLKEFLDKTACHTYGAAWKRTAFFKFVDMFRDPTLTQVRHRLFIIFGHFSGVVWKKSPSKIVLLITQRTTMGRCRFGIGPRDGRD